LSAAELRVLLPQNSGFKSGSVGTIKAHG
jgi:hypothetical protein